MITKFKLFELSKFKERLFDKIQPVLNAEVGTILTESSIYVYAQYLHRNDDDFYEGNLGKRIEKYKFYKLVEIPIDKLNLDEWNVEDDIVDVFVKKYKISKNYPPIIITPKYSIIDGIHRANALKNSDVTTIKAWIGMKNIKPS